jgi:hypothetical protein
MTVESYNLGRRRFLRTLACAVPVLCAGDVWATAAAPLARPVDLRFITRELPLRRRSEWTSIPPNPQRLCPVGRGENYTKITLHHAGMGVVRATSEGAVISCLDGLIGGHLRRRFGDVGYHFIIDYAGRVWEGRSLSYWGAHVSGHNEENVGIVLLGNFEEQRPARAQLRVMDQLVTLLRRHYRIGEGHVYGHIDLGRTLCPGKYLYPRVQRLNQLA